MFPALLGAWNWFARSPVAQIIVGIIVWVIGYEVVKSELEKSGAKKERKEQARRNAEELARVETTRREITTENQNAQVRAEQAAAASPRFNSYDELRNRDPGAAAELFGDSQAGDGRTTRG